MANANLGIIIRAVDQFSGTFRKLANDLGVSQKAVGAMTGALAAITASAVAGKFVEIGKEVVALGIDAEEVRGSFDSLARSAGMNSSRMLSDLRKASRGMSNDLDLMKSANRAFLSDNKVVAQNLTTIYEAAAIGADALGVGVTEAFDRITRSITTMQSRGLKEFGINIDQAAAFDAYARGIGKVADELSTAEQEIAFANAVLPELRDLISRSGSSADSAGDNIDQFRSSIENLKIAMGELVVSSGGFNALDVLTEKVNTVTNEIKIISAEWKFFADRVDLTNWNSIINAFDEYVTIMQRSNGDLELQAQLLNAVTDEANPAMLSLYSLGDGAQAAADGVERLNRALGAVGARNYVTAVYGGVMNAPSATMFGGSPAQYGYERKTEGQQQQLVTDELNKQTEAERSKAEYARRYNTQLQERKALLESIKSKAESILTGGASGPSAGDFLATKAGTYQDKPMEAALRLAAIAERGFEEIKKHSDWAGALMIPPEILSGSEAQLKDWAARTRQNVLDLTRPDLINWEAFGRQWDEQVAKEAQKEQTINQALQFLQSTGRLKGGGEANRALAAEALGLGTPQSQAETFASGFAEAIGQKDLANLFLGSFDADVSNNKDTIRKSGASLGGVIIDGVNTGVRDNVGSVRKTIAYFVAPEVAAILEAKDGAKP